MSTAAPPKLMTAEEFLALPDDGVERWLIRGELREKRDTDVTRRSRPHGITVARVTAILGRWQATRPEPRGAVVCGDAGLILRRDPDTAAGVDVAVLSAAQADSPGEFPEGPPPLIAEVLSPYDTHGEVAERVEEYLACGVPVVWEINPYSRTVIVHRPGASPDALDDADTLAGDPELPGFSCPVAEFFR